MKIQCLSCSVGFSVPDEKIPKGREVRLLCPKCRMPIELNRVEESEVEDTTDTDLGFEPDEESFPMEMDYGDMETLLLCVSHAAKRERLERALRNNFNIKVAVSGKAAVGELHHNRYDVVLLDETFDASNREGNPVLRYIQPLPMQIRRPIFLCLFCDALQTMDYMAAFRLGVNLIINDKDLDKTTGILDRSAKEHKLFYKVYRDELETKGRA